MASLKPDGRFAFARTIRELTQSLLTSRGPGRFGGRSDPEPECPFRRG